MKNGANYNIQDKYGDTMLHSACGREGYSKILELLLESGTNPNIQDNSGHTVLFTHIMSGMHISTGGKKVIDYLYSSGDVGKLLGAISRNVVLLHLVMIPFLSICCILGATAECINKADKFVYSVFAMVWLRVHYIVHAI